MTAPSTTAGGPVLRRLSRPFAALAATALPTAYIAAVDPNTPGHYPLCPFRQATGWWCPGCGGLRCVHALAHGEFTAGLHDNLLAVVLFVVLGVLWVRWAFAALTGGPGRGWRWGRPGWSRWGWCWWPSPCCATCRPACTWRRRPSDSRRSRLPAPGPPLVTCAATGPQGETGAGWMLCAPPGAATIELPMDVCWSRPPHDPIGPLEDFGCREVRGARGT
ncbi:DUF2752 domain-containing protein [Kitasatospora acidiphila]|uniref:DUF2752 domain-containing protein n=1 Tax=Kitasatospora acidiphila TaxID=2567942 RepID=UPI001E4E3211|nr:DUF2752 domain-containing protein [Kitasatospora acidiphila]